MTARISKNFAFDAAIHCDAFAINHYEIKLYIDVITDNNREQNIAFNRIKYIIEDSLENCVFVNESQQDLLNKYSFAGLRVCPLPEDPYDQIIAAVVMSKLNAVIQDKMNIVEISIISKLCDGIEFHITQLEDLEYQARSGVWYTDSTPCICGNPASPDKLKIKKEDQTWNKLGLGWKSSEPEIIQNKEIAFAPTVTTPLH